MNIQRAIKKCKKEIAKLEDKDNLSIHGFWSLGYWQGRLSALEDIEDDDKKEAKKRNHPVLLTKQTEVCI